MFLNILYIIIGRCLLNIFTFYNCPKFVGKCFIWDFKSLFLDSDVFSHICSIKYVYFFVSKFIWLYRLILINGKIFLKVIIPCRRCSNSFHANCGKIFQFSNASFICFINTVPIFWNDLIWWKLCQSPINIFVGFEYDAAYFKL